MGITLLQLRIWITCQPDKLSKYSQDQQVKTVQSHACHCVLVTQMAVMLLVLALYKWEELAVYAAVSVAAATPKRSDAEVAHPVKSPAFFSQSPSEVAILLAACPESPADRTQSTVWPLCSFGSY